MVSRIMIDRREEVGVAAAGASITEIDTRHVDSMLAALCRCR